MRMKYGLLAAAAAMLASTGASALDWEGYARIGPGSKSNDGNGRSCYNGAGFGGHGGIGRLGNECNTYGEFALSQKVDAGGGVSYKVLLMTNLYTPGSEVGSTSDGGTMRMNQLYVEGTGYDIAPSLTFWIGKRFYHRADVHFDDTFFVNMTGTGAGVDGIKPGAGQMSIAAFRLNDDVSNATFHANSGTRLNFDWEKIDVNPGGQLRLTLGLTDFGDVNDGEGGTIKGKNGVGLSLQHNQTLVADSSNPSKDAVSNTFWAQFTKGSAGLDMNFGNALEGSDVKRWRIVESVTALKGPLTGQGMFQFGKNKSDDGEGYALNGKYYTVGGRLAYALTNNFKMQGELAYSSAKPDDGGERQGLTKFTIAPTLTVGPDYYSRPELRLYASYFKFNDAYAAANGLTNKSKTAVGFQAEIWF